MFSSLSPHRGLPSQPCPFTLPSLCADITGPIILQTYRAIADYEKSSGTEMTVATGDVVDVVEKSESGQPYPHPVFVVLFVWRGHMYSLSSC